MLFFRFDFCVPTSDEKTPTENLGQVNNNNTEINLYDFDQVDLNQPKRTIGTLSRIHEFSSNVNTWCTFSGSSLRILVAGVTCNITGEYFKRASHLNKKIVVSYQTLTEYFCVVNGEFSNLWCLINTLHSPCSVYTRATIWWMPKEYKMFIFADSPIALASNLQALCLQPCASLHAGIA